MIDRALRKLFNAESPPPMIWEPEVHGRLYADRPYFLTRVRQGMSKLPPELQAAFKEQNYKVDIARNVKRFFSLKNQPEEYQKGDKFLEAFFNGVDKNIVMPQANFWGTLLQQWKNFDDGENASIDTAHELGHAFDRLLMDDGRDALDKIEDNTIDFSRFDHDFIEKLKYDLAQLDKSQQRQIEKTHPALRVLDADDDTFRSEIFAEIFADIILERKTLSKILPNVADLIENQIENFCEQYRTANPDFDPDTHHKMEVAQA